MEHIYRYTSYILWFCLIPVTLLASDLSQMLRQAHQGNDPSTVLMSADFVDDVTWLQVANVGQPFGRASGGILGNYYYVFGAIDEPRAQAYNWNNDHWSMGTEPPLGNCNWCGVSTGESIYLIGRYRAYEFGDEVQVFTPLGNGPQGTWATAANYPLAIAGIAAAWDGENTIYAAGGSDLVEVYSACYKYNIAEDEWSEIAELPIPMSYHGGVFIEGEFHVMGGVQEPSTAHYIYNPETDAWRAGVEMPYANPFALFSLIKNEDFILSIGGGGGYSVWPARNVVQLFDPRNSTWEQLTPLPVAHGLNAAAWLPDDVVLSAGGFNEGSFSQDAFEGAGFPIGPGVSVKPSETAGTLGNYDLLTAYPNPFNPEITVQYQVAQTTHVSLSIATIDGKVVAELIDTVQNTGEYHASFDAGERSTGLYLIILRMNDTIQVKKVLLLK